MGPWLPVLIQEGRTVGWVPEPPRPVHVVSAGWWQAAEPLGDYALAGCTVGPGFDFADFTLLAEDEARAAAFLRLHEELKHLL